MANSSLVTLATFHSKRVNEHDFQIQVQMRLITTSKLFSRRTLGASLSSDGWWWVGRDKMLPELPFSDLRSPLKNSLMSSRWLNIAPSPCMMYMSWLDGPPYSFHKWTNMDRSRVLEIVEADEP